MNTQSFSRHFVPENDPFFHCDIIVFWADWNPSPSFYEFHGNRCIIHGFSFHTNLEIYKSLFILESSTVVPTKDQTKTSTKQTTEFPGEIDSLEMKP